MPTFLLAVYAAVMLVAQRNHIPALSLGIERHGALVISAGYGDASPDAIYRIGSLTKAFTALAVDDAIARGRLQRGQRVVTFDPSYVHAANVTIAELLDHTGGIPSYSDVASLDPYARHSPQSLVAAVEDLPLENEPGAAFYYSNTGYALLGIALASAAHEPYARVIARLISTLRLRSTAYGDAPGELAGFRYDGARNLPARRTSVSYGYAAAGISSNVPDLLHAIAASAPSYDGWLYGTLGGRSVRFLNGNVDGYSAVALVEPVDDDAIVILCNEGRVDLVPLAHDLLDAIAPPVPGYAP